MLITWYGKIIVYFVSVNMFVFSDVTRSKGFESIVPKADGSVQIVDVYACLEGPILKVDVATNIEDLVTQVDQACCTGDLILQVDATCDTSGLISTRQVSTCTYVILTPMTQSIVQEQS